MRRIFCVTLTGFIVALLLAGFAFANNALRVDEARTTLQLKDGHTVIALTVDNPDNRALSVRVSLQLLDPNDKVRAQANGNATLRDNGANTVTLALPFRWADLKGDERSQFYWYRVRYEVAPTVDNSPPAPVSGMVSVSQLDAQLFEFEAFTPPSGQVGKSLPVRVRAVHPSTRQPVAGVQMRGALEYDGDKPQTLRAESITDADGYAALNFPSLPDVREYEVTLTVTGQLDDFTQTGRNTVRVPQAPRVIANTDKPLYQPGQTLHARILVFTPAGRAWAGQKVTLKVEDPDDQIVFRSDATTSRFGVAHFDWPIAADTKLGSYSLTFDDDAKDDGESDYDQLDNLSVRVSRYDLPNFAVNVKPDRPYYLPGQKAEIAVRGDYLFGQTVKRGRVRVVREEERTWNYKTQKYETKEAEEFKGETNDADVFTARIDLGPYHKELRENEYNRFRDITYAAYFTDLTTNRTEQRRFDVRVTKEAIHLYFVKPEYQFPKKLPLEFYLTASYADGAPCTQCSIAIRETDDESKPLDEGPRGPVRTVVTNAYGVAKVADLRPSESLLDEYNPAFTFTARDKQGRTGRFTDDFYWADGEALRLSAARTLYRAGEPFTVQLRSSVPNAKVFLDVTSAGRLRYSTHTRLADGRAAVVIPYAPEFRNAITINAFAATGDDSLRAAYAVFYPHNDELKLELKPDRATHQPGQEAQIDFNLRTPDGEPAESALGVVVFDRAVEERARTDAEFGGGRFGFYWWSSSGSVAGVTERGLAKIDWSQKLPDGLDLAAEALLNSSRNYQLETFDGEGHARSASYVYEKLLQNLTDTAKRQLNARYQFAQEYPRDEAALRRLLASVVNLDALRDPWGQPFRYDFGTDKANDTLKFVSAGPDKKFGNGDDATTLSLAWFYFRPYAELIERAGREYRQRIGAHIRDAATLKAELLRLDCNFDQLRDRWGLPYRLEITPDATGYNVSVTSNGPNGVAQVVGGYATDDFFATQVKFDTFAEIRARIETALVKYLARAGHYPADAKEFRAALRADGLDFDELRDPRGFKYFVTITEHSRYADQTTVRATPGSTPQTIITPVTQKYVLISITGAGNNGKEGGPGITSFAGLLSSQSAQSQQSNKPNLTLAKDTGAISGRVVDPQGAVIPGATIVATNTATSDVYSTVSDSEGAYFIRNLPPGSYSLRFAANGFKVAIVEQTAVTIGKISEIMMMLEAGAVSETVTVTAGREVLQTTNASVATTITENQIQNLPINARNSAEFLSLKPGAGASATTAKQDIATPRLREYFPETLVWQPELVTDANGQARLKFKFADNITTWKMSVIGSTVDGQLGLAETELPAFQPFFADHDPPRTLTEGDEIALPVVLRNYLDKQIDVSATMQPESWFSLTGAAEQRASVPAGDARPVVFPFRAVSSVTDGKQRVTALSSEASDAIEKPVTVHPDGEERSATAGDLLDTAATMEIDVPTGVIKPSLRGAVKIYPNLLAHVGESVEGILQRPYGCGEQTISSTYPNLLILRYDKQTGTTSPVHARAERYLKLGYERLLNFRADTGGFNYWGRGEADIALTAYALRFLSEARDFIAVDPQIIAGARDWLGTQQRADGAWPAYDYWPRNQENAARTLLQTSYIARVLAASGEKPQKALEYVGGRLDVVDEPHFIANYALSADAAGQARAVAKLRAMAKEEGATAYWKLETNTPFYSWGTAGRVETTALAVQALTKNGAAEDKPLINRALLFLLQNKDGYGVWYSTQATVNVLDALIGQVSAASVVDSAAPVTVLVNGQRAGEIALPDVKGVAAPVTLDVAQYLQAGRNTVELQRAAGASRASVNFVARYYMPWADAQTNVQTGAARTLRLAVKYNKTQARVRDEIICTVNAKRVGFMGYGMMLGEIGLPPGADVDRASLEKAVTDSGWSLTRYDVLPDKIIVYLWPRAGGVNFSFKFKPRYGINAQTAPSVLYDYYNPEARAVVTPARFTVK